MAADIARGAGLNDDEVSSMFKNSQSIVRKAIL
jgi:hypothetical protein